MPGSERRIRANPTIPFWARDLLETTKVVERNMDKILAALPGKENVLEQTLAAALRVNQPSENASASSEESDPTFLFRRICLSIADVLQADNPRFDRERFIKAVLR